MNNDVQMTREKNFPRAVIDFDEQNNVDGVLRPDRSLVRQPGTILKSLGEILRANQTDKPAQAVDLSTTAILLVAEWLREQRKAENRASLKRERSSRIKSFSPIAAALIGLLIAISADKEQARNFPDTPTVETDGVTDKATLEESTLIVDNFAGAISSSVGAFHAELNRLEIDFDQVYKEAFEAAASQQDLEPESMAKRPEFIPPGAMITIEIPEGFWGGSTVTSIDLNDTSLNNLPSVTLPGRYNFRNGPGTNYSALEVLPRDTEILLLTEHLGVQIWGDQESMQGLGVTVDTATNTLRVVGDSNGPWGIGVIRRTGGTYLLGFISLPNLRVQMPEANGSSASSTPSLTPSATQPSGRETGTPSPSPTSTLSPSPTGTPSPSPTSTSHAPATDTPMGTTTPEAPYSPTNAPTLGRSETPTVTATVRAATQQTETPEPTRRPTAEPTRTTIAPTSAAEIAALPGANLAERLRGSQMVLTQELAPERLLAVDEETYCINCSLLSAPEITRIIHESNYQWNAAPPVDLSRYLPVSEGQQEVMSPSFSYHWEYQGYTFDFHAAYISNTLILNEGLANEKSFIVLRIVNINYGAHYLLAYDLADAANIENSFSIGVAPSAEGFLEERAGENLARTQGIPQAIERLQNEVGRLALIKLPVSWAADDTIYWTQVLASGNTRVEAFNNYARALQQAMSRGTRPPALPTEIAGFQNKLRFANAWTIFN